MERRSFAPRTWTGLSWVGTGEQPRFFAFCGVRLGQVPVVGFKMEKYLGKYRKRLGETGGLRTMDHGEWRWSVARTRITFFFYRVLERWLAVTGCLLEGSMLIQATLGLARTFELLLGGTGT